MCYELTVDAAADAHDAAVQMPDTSIVRVHPRMSNGAMDHCRSLPLTQQWGCFRDIEKRLKSAATSQPVQPIQQKPAAAAPPNPASTGGSEELRD